MPLEQFKTQVLLLHSEQNTLDTLSTGFDDRYTVHCATSGSEALTTLGEVPIHVIVSAHKLPGMSGLDALREAQKRSPETIGILLAGSEGGDVEALVGEKDMFQVVREEVTPESLRQMIDRATQQARLMALAQSAANDTSANMDQPTGEHIVMETSENGSTIISDGTGRFPALNPAKISAEKAVGARAVGVIVLSQDEEFLKTVRESTRGNQDIHHATTISQADDLAGQHKIGVAVIDAAMVGTNVEKMTLHLRKTSSRLVAIVAGRRDDGDMLMDLINRGKVYRFLLKPVSPGRARLAIEASVKYHLEAPDSAFRIAAPDPADTAAGATKPTPSRAVVPIRPEPQKAAPEPRSAPAGNEQVATGASPAGEARAGDEPRNELPEIDVDAAAAQTAETEASPVIEDLGDAFEDSGSFAKTMTGVFKARGDDDAGNAAAAEATKPVARDGGAGGAGLMSTRSLGTAAAVLVAVAAAGWWLAGDDAEPPAATRTVVTTPPAEAITPPPEPRETAVAADEPAEPPEPVIELDEVLADARSAVEAGRIYAPDRDNAIGLYLAAAAELPGNEQVAAELEATVDRALGLAENALLQRETGEVPTILARVSAADPDNARLAFLEAQLADVEVRLALADARLAIREERFDEAAAALDTARGMGGSVPEEIETVAAELAQARIDQQVAAILDQAAARLDDGALVSPAGDSARHYYELALETDPGNVAARQGLVAIASRLVLQALAEIDARAFPEAERILAEARAVDPESGELASAVEALAAGKEAVEQERLEAERLAAEKARAEREAAERAERERIAREREAAERAERERLAREREAAEQAERERLAREREAAERERLAREREAAEQAERERLAREREAAERAAQERAAAERAAAAARLAADAQPTPTRQPPPRQAAPSRPAPAETPAPARQPDPDLAARNPEPTPGTQTSASAPPAMQAATAPPAAAEPADAGQAAGDAGTPAAGPAAEEAPAERPVVPVSSLNRTRYVAPKYPRVAERRNQTGWVDVILTVSGDGSVSNVEVIAAQPGDVFVDAATDAVERWEFEPVIEDGEAVEQRAAVRMMFAIE